MALKDEDEREVKAGTEAGDTEGEIIAVETPPETQQDERISQQAQEEDDDGEPNAANDAEREARRLERRARKEREKAAKERNRKELDFLRNRNEVLERRFSAVEQRQMQSEAVMLDGKIGNFESLIREAEAVYAQAINGQKGEDAAEAMRIRDALMAQRNEHVAYKQHLSRQAQQAQQPRQEQQQPEQPQRVPVSPELLSHADKWMKANSWYKPGADDEASAITTAIDNAVAAEGYDPETAEYWQELSKRVAARVPEKVSQQQGSQRSSGGPSMANGGRGDRALKPGEIYISPERKAALMDMGVWDDPKLRQRYLKRYQQYDAEAGNKSRSA
jgi:hypothetical protein